VGQATIQRESFRVLDAVADVLAKHPDLKRVRVEGHTDGDGSEAANLDLSQRRTAAVKTYLVGRGIDPDRLIPQGFGESRPIDSNATEYGKANNRRVEFVVLD
jgi:outer membrane protein OmpA-like peptidoglycan-associated protein